MVKEIRPAIILIVALTLITGLVYPMVTTGLAYIFFPHQAKGSLIDKDGKVIGSELIGQQFAGDQYFHGRPSATTAPDPKDPSKTVEAPYNAANSGGSNMGPTSKALIERVKGDVEKLETENPARPCRRIWLPPREAGSIPIFLRKGRCSRSRASPRRAGGPRIASVSSSMSIRRDDCLVSWASPVSTFLRLISRSTVPQPIDPQ